MKDKPNTKTLILEIKFGGLGDHLFYSHIPRIAKETGIYEKVLISNRSPFRHPDYKKLIWEMNPFVDGFTDEPGISGNIPGVLPSGQNILDGIMLSLGLDDGTRFHSPELQYQPTNIPDLNSATLYDPNYVSNVGWIDSTDMQNKLRELGVHIDTEMKPRDKSITVPADRIIQSKSLEDFCDIIHSCKSLYCLGSGTATLADALGKPATVFYGYNYSNLFRHSKRHTYVFVKEAPLKHFIHRLVNGLRRRFNNLRTS